MNEATVPVMTLTDQGANMISRAIAQEELYITRLAMGDGQLANVGGIPGLTALVQERVSVPVVKTARKGRQLTVSGPVVMEADAAAFRWRELGVVARIGTEPEQLLGYLYKGESGEMVSPADGMERNIYITLEIDPAAHVEVVLSPRESVEWGQISDPPATYAPCAHTHSTDDLINGVLPVARGGTGKSTALTAADVGAAAASHSHTLSALGAAAATHKHGAGDITSGVLPVARGGTGKSTALTATDVGAATATHKHGAGDITSGVLPVARGGTGKSTALTAADVGALPLSGGALTGDLKMKGKRVWFGDSGGTYNSYIDGSNNDYDLFIQAGNYLYVRAPEEISIAASSSLNLSGCGIYLSSSDGVYLPADTSVSSTTDQSALLRNIKIGTGAMTAGSTALTTGTIYLQYE